MTRNAVNRNRLGRVRPLLLALAGTAPILLAACSGTPAAAPTSSSNSNTIATTSSASNAPIQVIGPWARAMPAMVAGGATPMAGMSGMEMGSGSLANRNNSAIYLTLKNSTGTEDRLISAESPVAEVVELHETTMQGNVMRMQKVPSIAAPAGGTVELKPGGYHVMLIGLKNDLTAGSQVPLTLVFEKSGKMTVQAEVRQAGS